ncbi:MAG: TfpX/TfpZ family type IV pilin accessory protein [Methylococcaceae bacterium]
MKPLKTRFSTFLTHLGLSAMVAVIAIILVFFVWYPTPLYDAQGVTRIFLLLLAVDISIGPLITLLTYKPTIGFLKFDLPVIILLQVLALLYGMHTVFQARPAFIVFNRSNFSVVRVVDLEAKSLKLAQANNNEAAIPSWFTPRWVAAIPSKDVNRQNEVLFSKTDWNQLAESFAPLNQAKEQLLNKAHSLQDLKSLYEKNNVVLAQLNALQGNIKWLPLMALAKNMVVLINADTGEVITILDIDPTPNAKAA